mgnify:CR=1 FL=1
MPGQSGPVTKLYRNLWHFSAFVGILAVPLPYGVGMQIAGEEGGALIAIVFNFLDNRL